MCMIQTNMLWLFFIKFNVQGDILNTIGDVLRWINLNTLHYMDKYDEKN